MQVWGIGNDIEKTSFISFSKYREEIIQGPYVYGLYLSYVILKIPLLRRQVYIHRGTNIKY